MTGHVAGFVTGTIDYIHDVEGKTGEERFLITANRDGSRTLRATCVMQENDILRDVTYTVDQDWRPMDAFVRLHVGERHLGSSLFVFEDKHVECRSRSSEASISQFVSVPRRPDVFASHPLAADAWQAAAFDHASNARRQTVLAGHCSPRPDGGSQPIFGSFERDIEYIGQEAVEVPAGSFEAQHYLLHSSRSDWPPLMLWVTSVDRLFIKLRWDLLASTYVLSSLSNGV